jgi:hypothetical protein
MTAVGINNPNSYYNRDQRGFRAAAVKSPAYFTITSYAEKIAGRYEAALMLIKGGLVAKGERLAKEYETQLSLLTEYVNDMAEAGVM